MGNGLRYETGRDMPPAMAEKLAVQIARRLQAEEKARRQQMGENEKKPAPGSDK